MNKRTRHKIHNRGTKIAYNARNDLTEMKYCFTVTATAILWIDVLIKSRKLLVNNMFLTKMMLLCMHVFKCGKCY